METASRITNNGTMNNLESIEGIWTAVGINEQSTVAGKTKFPRSKYPLKWYMGFSSHGEEEEQIATEIVDTIKALGEEEAKCDKVISMVGVHIYGYFRQPESFAKVIKVIVKEGTLEVEQYFGETKEISAKDILEDARKMYQKWRKRYPAEARMRV